MSFPIPRLGRALPLALALAAPTLGQAHWPGFRGAASGHADSVPLALGEKAPAPLWKVALAGPGHSSPVTHGERIFLTSSAPEGQARIVQALALKDGKQLARASFAFEPYPTHRLNGFVSSTPSVDAEGLYLAWNEGGRLLARGLSHDLEALWEVDLGPHACGHGWGTSSLLVDGTLVVASDSDAEESFLVGLNPKDGKERWRRKRRSQRGAYCSPIAVATEDAASQVLFGSTAHGLTCLDAASGKLAWEVDDLFESRVVASPVIADQVALLMGGSGGGGKDFAAVALPGQPDAGQVRYRIRRNLPYVPTPIYGQGLVYLFSDGGIVSALQANTGKLQWRERTEGEYFGSPILAGDRLYALTKAGVLIVLAAADRFEHLGSLDLGERAFSTPAVAAGTLLLRTETQLFAFAPE